MDHPRRQLLLVQPQLGLGLLVDQAQLLVQPRRQMGLGQLVEHQGLRLNQHGHEQLELGLDWNYMVTIIIARQHGAGRITRVQAKTFRHVC